MKPARLIGWVLTVMCIASAGTEAAMQNAGEAVDADTAVFALAAFECSQYARMAGEPEHEAARLFRLGYENGKRFAAAAHKTKMSEERRNKLPKGVLRVMDGPTTDFILGRIFEYATREAYYLVVRGDKLETSPSDKWRLPEAQKIYAGTEYRSRNCALLK
jgi:hypothetical protein